MILISKYLVPKGYLGLTCYPFVFLKTEDLKLDSVLINHEKIHLRQQIEMLVFPFYIIYGIEFVIRFMQYKNWHTAYKNISFEREAYINEGHLDYLKQRKFWDFLKYLRSNDI
ncbi:hypothetical protein EV196_10128 [Mariniflexile fucanivorans]|uniref:Uncharacterized protein n=1 Tax=Mariniflexile fucanivorans TaxID=264023 RepID=A0A4R1RQD2_9FLAO|nr:hypothetical protein [Mariniflexile fucanivorans]TCL68613.1 hypothetical protein EV196_10128 [Mariniflexile fucanivorans]